MKPLYLNIKSEYIPLLLFLYPSYSLLDKLVQNNNFIIVKDITSPAEKNTLDFRYEDCIFISSKVFDENWTEDVLKEKFLEFARVRFKSRKKTLKITETGNEFVEAIKQLIFVNPLQEELNDNEVVFLFSEFGSANFSKAYFRCLATHPFPVVRSALMTFIQKVIIGEASIFYRKKNMLFGEKIKHNFLKALTSYQLRPQDNDGLSFLKFIKDLTK